MKHTIKCPNCTAPLEVEQGDAYAVRCSYCGMSTPIPEALRTRSDAGSVVRLSDDAVARIVSLIAAGKSMEAIALIRTTMNIDLEAARRLHDAMKGGDAVTLNALLHGEGIVRPTVVVRPRSCLFSIILWIVVLTVVAVVVVNALGISWLRNVTGLLPPAVGERVNVAVEAAVPPYAGLAFRSDAVLVGDDAARPDIVAMAFDVSDSKSLLTYVDSAADAVRWRSEVDSQTSFVVADDAVYAATKSRLRAIDRVTGATRWEASLSDEISSACDACIFADAARIYVLSNDAEVQAFDPADGRKVWSVTLSPIAPRIFMWGDRLVVVDRDEEYESGIAGRVRVFDAAGETSSTFHPSCEIPKTPRSTGGEEFADPDSAMHIDAADGVLYMWLGGFSSCLQKYALADGALLWSAQLDVDAENERAAQFLRSGDALYVVGDETILAAEIADGQTRVLHRFDEDYDDAYLYGESAGALVYHTTTTRGTRRFALQALDVATGEVRWTTKFEDDGGPFTLDADFTGLLSDSDIETAWTAHVTPKAVRVLRISSKPFRFVFENIDATTGVADGRVETPIGWNPLLLGPALVGRRGDVVWVHLDDSIVALDTATKQVVRRVGR